MAGSASEGRNREISLSLSLSPSLFSIYIYIQIPGTQMTLVFIGKDLVLKGSTTKVEDIHRFQVYKFINPLVDCMGAFAIYFQVIYI